MDAAEPGRAGRRSRVLVAISFAAFGAAANLFFIESSNRVLMTGGFGPQVRILFVALLALWLAFYGLVGLAVRFSPGGSFADRCGWLFLPFLVWTSATGLLFEADIQTFLSMTRPGLQAWMGPLWLLGSLLLFALLVLATGALARRVTVMREKRWPFVLALAAGLAWVGLFLAPSGPPGALAGSVEGDDVAGLRVVLFGVDGADWKTIDALVAEGDLPAFARLRKEGLTGELGTLGYGPSPIIWTAAATGRTPEEHGVLGMYDYYSPRLGVRLPRTIFNPFNFGLDTLTVRKEVYYTDWLAKPVWSVLSELSQRVLVVNWFFSYPAVPLNGVMISDREDFYLRLCEGETAAAPSLAWYPARIAIAEPARVCGTRTSMADLVSRIGWREELDGGPRIDACGGGEACAPDRADRFLTRQGVSVEAFLQLRQAGDYRLAAYLTRLVDGAGHRYTRRVFHPNPRDGRYVMKVSEAEREELWQANVGAYRHVDAALGRLLDALDEDTVLLVISDHGWDDYDGSHHIRFPPGVIAFFGARVDTSAALDSPHVYDVAPTVLWLTGAPVSRELGGRVLTQVVDAGAAGLAPVRLVDSFGLPDAEVTAGYEPEEHERHLEELRALGYVR